MSLPVESIRSAFPIFSHHPELVYLDNAATSQKPQVVIDTMNTFYTSENANIHRGLYELSANATQRYEEVRSKVCALLGATNPKTIAFTKGTTESINLVANSFLKKKLNRGDKVVISAMEHHANLIPWQQLCIQKGASLEIIPVDSNGELTLKGFSEMLDSKTKLVAITHISNTLGTINPVEEIIDQAHAKNIPVLVDGAQSVGHHPWRLVEMNADFIAFSAHKMFGPQGVGALYCHEDYFSEMEPYNFGGGIIKHVKFSGTEFMDYPHSMEAGTANVAGVIGLGAAIDFIGQLNLEETSTHVKSLATSFRQGLEKLDIKQIGMPKAYCGIVSFQVGDIHPHDASSFLSESSVAVRAGHHCTQPLLEAMGVKATVRASFSIYNTPTDVDLALHALGELQKFWK